MSIGAINFSVKSDVEKVKRALTEAQRKLVPQATVAALNRAVKQSQTAAVREVAGSLKITSKIIRSKIRHQKRDKARTNYWEAGLFTVLSDIPAVKIGKPRQTRQGVTVKGRSFPGAFLATMPSKHTGVMRRRTQRRLPIEEVKVSIREKMEPAVENALRTVGTRVFVERFHYELNRRLKARGLS